MRKLTVGIVGVTLALGASACSPTEEAIPEPRVRDSVTEIVSQDTYTEFAQSTSTLLAESDKSLNADKIPGRITGPLETARTSEYRLKKVMKDNFTLDPIVIDEQAYPVASGTEFPRSLMTVTGPADGENLSTLSVWTQESARERYKLWADVELFPGVKIPGLVTAQSDTPGYLSGDGSDLAATPQTVLEQYSSLLYSDKASGVTFSKDDPLKTETANQLKSLKTTLGDLGKVSMSAKPSEQGYQAVSTEDGGLVVAGELVYNFSISKSQSDTTLTLGGELGAWLSNDAEDPTVDIKKNVSFNYRTTVAFYIPPADAKDKTVEVIGSSVPIISSAKTE